jgi:hypothetical protein
LLSSLRIAANAVILAAIFGSAADCLHAGRLNTSEALQFVQEMRGGFAAVRVLRIETQWPSASSWPRGRQDRSD